MGLQERNFPEGGALVPTFRRSGAPAAGGQGTAGKKRSTALAGWGRSGAQLVGVTGIFAVVGAQVVAKAESSPLVTLAGLFLAGGSAAWMGRGESGPGRLGPATQTCRGLLWGPCSQPHSAGSPFSWGMFQGWVRERAESRRACWGPGCWEAWKFVLLSFPKPTPLPLALSPMGRPSGSLTVLRLSPGRVHFQATPSPM